MIEHFIRVSGYLNAIAGMVLLVYWYSFAIFLPYRKLSNTLSILVKNQNWQWINALGVIGAIAGLMGQAGIFVFQMTNPNGYGMIGFFVVTMGTVMIIGTMLWDTILWPIIVQQDERMLDFQGPIYSSKLFLPFFIAAGLIFSVGYVFVGIGIIKSNVFAKIVGDLIAIGAPAFGLGAIFGKYQVYPRTLGITLMSVGLIWTGIEMVF